MKKIYIKIEGMTCNHCKIKIKKTLENIDNIKDIHFDKNIAEVVYNGKIDKEEIIKNITEIGYYTDLKMISENKKNPKVISVSEFINIALIIILLMFGANEFFGYNIFNIIPTINSDTTYVMLFVIGLLTSVHCVSMCGAINLMASASETRDYKKPILYNLGRLTSYTLLGGIVGLLGSVFQINTYAQGMIIIIAAIFMFLMALNMMGVINLSLKFKKTKVFNKLRTKEPFIIGLLNGLMPCGPLQAMQVFALSTGSFIYGALSMFLFCLGTIPLMLFMGMISNFLNNKNRQILNKISMVLILLLSLVMLNRGLLNMGVDFSNVAKPNYDNYLKSKMVDDYQAIEFNLTYGGYKDIIVQKGVPVRMIINATDNTLTGCNNGIKINSFNIATDLEVGSNLIEFTPNETGVFTYTCWMGMLKNTIIVVDDLTIFQTADGVK